jgi:hypothetical protein
MRRRSFPPTGKPVPRRSPAGSKHLAHLLHEAPTEGNETSPRPLRAARRSTLYLNRIRSLQHFQTILAAFRIS